MATENESVNIRGWWNWSAETPTGERRTFFTHSKGKLQTALQMTAYVAEYFSGLRDVRVECALSIPKNNRQ